MSFDGPPVQFGDRMKLNMDDRTTLETKILPTARRWVQDYPSLRSQAIQTLGYWQEPIPRFKGDSTDKERNQ